MYSGLLGDIMALTKTAEERHISLEHYDTPLQLTMMNVEQMWTNFKLHPDIKIKNIDSYFAELVEGLFQGTEAVLLHLLSRPS